MPSDSVRYRKPLQRCKKSLVVICVLLTGGWAIAGCSVFNFGPEDEQKLLSESKSDTAQKESQSSSAKQVRWDGGGVLIGETGETLYSPDDFLQNLAKFQEQGRQATIKNLIEKYPDVALETLQQSDPRSQSVPTLQALAAGFDQAWCASPEWQKYVMQLSQQSDDPQSLSAMRQEFHKALQQRAPQRAAKLKLANQINGDTVLFLRADIYRLESIAAMMQDDHDQAIKLLKQSIVLVSNECPYFKTKLSLILGEFYRHAGNGDEWKTTWKESVIENSELVLKHGQLDPVFWERASYLRPAGQAWPEQAAANLGKYLVLKRQFQSVEQANAIGQESVFWVSVGIARQHRGESQNAILAFKKAEASAETPQLIAHLRLLQARAMVTAGQPGAASAMLYRIVADHEGTPMADRAKAILGAMKLQNGGVAQGMNLIESAIKTVDQWPRDEQLRAQADYGLALLIRGREEEGLGVLANVATDFQSLGEFDQLYQCLWNKAKYFEKTKQGQRHRAALAELKELDQTLY